MKTKKKSTLGFSLLFLLAGISLSVITLIIKSDLEAERTDPSEQITFLRELLSPPPQPTPTITLPVPPQQKMLLGGMQVFQTFNNCGPASLAMALSHYGIAVTQEELGSSLRPYQHPNGNNDDKSVTLRELAMEAQKYGLIAYHRPAGTSEVVKKFISSEMPVITRTWLKKGEDIGHYRVITGYDDAKREFIQDDSLQGKNIRFSYDDFDLLWKAFNYEFLVLVEPEKDEIARVILGDQLDEQRAWQIALSNAQVAARENQNDIYAWFNQSVAQYHLGEMEESVQLYEQVKDQLPSRILWYQIEPILAYYKLGDFDQVFAITDRIFQNHNRAFSELYYIRGKIYAQQGRQDLAEAEFAQAKFYNKNRNFDLETF